MPCELACHWRLRCTFSSYGPEGTEITPRVLPRVAPGIAAELETSEEKRLSPTPFLVVLPNP